MDQGDALSLSLVVLLVGIATWLANRGEVRALYELAREVGWSVAVAAAAVGAILLCLSVVVLVYFA